MSTISAKSDVAGNTVRLSVSLIQSAKRGQRPGTDYIFGQRCGVAVVMVVVVVVVVVTLSSAGRRWWRARPRITATGTSWRRTCHSGTRSRWWRTAGSTWSPCKRPVATSGVGPMATGHTGHCAYCGFDPRTVWPRTYLVGWRWGGLSLLVISTPERCLHFEDLKPRTEFHPRQERGLVSNRESVRPDHPGDSQVQSKRHLGVGLCHGCYVTT
ncbi:unnamed protein product, partial [Iphiclides podalirius]